MKKTFLAVFIGICLCGLAQAQTITVTSPVATDDWWLGSTHNITWTASGAMQATCAIRLRLAGSPESADPALVIANGTVNDGSFSWTIPNSVAPGSYFIRVRTDDSIVIGDSKVFRISGPVVVSQLPHERPPSMLLKYPRLKVSGIDLAPNTEGFGIVFSYKNVGEGALPKASEVPVKPSYRVLIDGRETASGSLFIPAFPAPPGWEQKGYFGGWILLPSSHFSYHMGKKIKVYINENKVMGMDSDSLELDLKPIALKYKLDLWCVAYTSTLDWKHHILAIQIGLFGRMPPAGHKILVSCRNVESNDWYFRTYVNPENPDEFYIRKKLDFPKEKHAIALYIEAYVVPLSYSEQILDIETGNNRIERIEFEYPYLNARHWVYGDWNY